MIEAVHTPDEAPVELKADTIVNALGSKKNIFDDTKLTVPFTYVGDCSGEKNGRYCISNQNRISCSQ